MISLTLPLPPSTNDRYLLAQNRPVLTDAVRRYDRVVAAAVAARNLAPPPPGRQLRALVDVVLTPKQRRDLDNCLKQLFDSLARALDFDDSRIVEIVARKSVGRHSYVHVQLTWEDDHAEPAR